MEVSLCKATLDDAAKLHEIQVKAFMPLLENIRTTIRTQLMNL